MSLWVSGEVSAAPRGSYLGALVQQRLCNRSADALRRAGHQRHFAVHVHGAAAAPASPRRRSFYVPGRARAPRPGALLRVGGDETVKLTRGHPGLCHLALSAPRHQAVRSLPS